MPTTTHTEFAYVRTIDVDHFALGSSSIALAYSLEWPILASLYIDRPTYAGLNGL